MTTFSFTSVCTSSAAVCPPLTPSLKNEVLNCRRREEISKWRVSARLRDKRRTLSPSAFSKSTASDSAISRESGEERGAELNEINLRRTRESETRVDWLHQAVTAEFVITTSESTRVAQGGGKERREGEGERCERNRRPKSKAHRTFYKSSFSRVPLNLPPVLHRNDTVNRSRLVVSAPALSFRSPRTSRGNAAKNDV